MFNIVERRKIFYAVSGALVLGSAASLVIFGLPLGIDFRGGSLMELSFVQDRPAQDDILKALQGLDIGNVLVQPSGDKNMILRFGAISEDKHQGMLISLQGQLGTNVSEERFESIGPTIGQELKRKALFAIVLVLVAIVLYIAWAFRQISRPVASWKYGVVAILALVHDVTIPTGIFSALSRFLGYEMDVLFVTAILTVLGFSVHDTIVVFDRIRENLKKTQSLPFPEVIEKSIHETMSRSINTSLTVLLVLLAIFFLGGESTRAFSLVMILGVFFGTYSSIFIASPLLVTWESLRRRKM